MLKNLNTTLRTLALLIVVLLAAWWTWYLRGNLTADQRELAERDERIEQLDADLASERERSADLQQLADERAEEITALHATVAERDETIAQQEAALRLLKIDHRLARVEVLAQREPTEETGWETDVRFTELGRDGAPIGEPHELTVAGRFLYLESLVVKFDDDHVEAGDFLRGTSIALFRRAFGEDQRPEDGTALDPVGHLPGAYGGDSVPDPFYAGLWERFWDYANDPEAAAAHGVRAIHGEAPYMELRPDRTYRVELRSSGGLSFQVEE